LGEENQAGGVNLKRPKMTFIMIKEKMGKGGEE